MNAGHEARAQLAQAKASVEALHLAQVPHGSWLAFRQTTSQIPDVDIGHISVSMLQALAQGFRSVQAVGAGEVFWNWLSQPADAGCNVATPEALSRVRALVVILRHVISGDSEGLSIAASVSYLALFDINGAQQSWGAIFHPTVFQKILCALKPLRAELRHQKASNDGSNLLDFDVHATQSDDDNAMSAEALTHDSMELFDVLVAFLRAHPITAASPEAATMTINELAMLSLHPAEEAVAHMATEGLQAVVAGARGLREVRRTASAVLHAVLPAMLMMQDKAASSYAPMPKLLQQTRVASLNLAKAIICGRPKLSMPRTTVPIDEEDASSEGEDEDKEIVLGAIEKEDKENKKRRVNDEKTKQGGDSKNDKEDEESGSCCEVVSRGSGDDDKQTRYTKRKASIRGKDDPILALLQLLCVLSPERAEWRAAAADAVLVLLTEAAAVQRNAMATQIGEMPTARDAVDIVVRFLEFLERLLCCERGSWRVIAAEVAALTLERSAALVGDNPNARNRLDVRLLKVLLKRCNDAVPTVRGRALNGVVMALLSLIGYPDGLNFLRAAIRKSSAERLHVDIAELFKAAALDEKAIVRRAALSFFDASMRLFDSPLGHDVGSPADYFQIELLERLANDDSLSVRKASISSLSLLLKRCPVPHVCSLWAGNVLPMTLDVESSVVERALEEVEAAILSPLAKLEITRPREIVGNEDLAIPLGPQLPAILESLDSEATEYLQRTVRCFKHRKQGTLLVPLVVSLVTIVRECLRLTLTSWPRPVWSLLEELTAIGVDGVPPKLIHDAWESFETAHAPNEFSVVPNGSFKPMLLGVQILTVLEHVATSLPPVYAQRLSRSLCNKLASLEPPPDQVCTAIRIIENLRRAGLVSAVETNTWRISLLQSVEAKFVEYVRQKEVDMCDRGVDISGGFFIFGELALVDESAISNSAVVALQTVVTNGAETNVAMRSHALAALGKLCLRREVLAKRLVELFVLHLGEHEPIAIRNNSLVILGDLCTHYTSLVDRFVPYMADMLRDPHQLLRRQAAIVLASLLSENFIKFRGLLMYRFLYALSDPADGVRHLIECIFARILHRRDPGVCSQNFVDVMCALNGWTGHPSYQCAVGNEQFSLSASPARRTVVYRFMLSLMTREQKFSVCSQLVTGFLAAFVVDEDKQSLELPPTEFEPSGQAFGDALALLVCKEMHICFSPKLAGQEEEDVEAESGSSTAAGVPTNAGVEAARGAFSGLLRQVVCESIVPVLTQLKERMEEQRSPFLGRLHNCFCEILREFKDDLKEFFGGDVRLAQEIKFDLEAAEFLRLTVDGPQQPRNGTGATKPSGCKRRQSIGSALASKMGATLPAEVLEVPVNKKCGLGKMQPVQQDELQLPGPCGHPLVLGPGKPLVSSSMPPAPSPISAPAHAQSAAETPPPIEETPDEHPEVLLPKVPKRATKAVIFPSPSTPKASETWTSLQSTPVRIQPTSVGPLHTPIRDVATPQSSAPTPGTGLMCAAMGMRSDEGGRQQVTPMPKDKQNRPSISNNGIGLLHFAELKTTPKGDSRAGVGTKISTPGVEPKITPGRNRKVIASGMGLLQAAELKTTPRIDRSAGAGGMGLIQTVGFCSTPAGGRQERHPQTRSTRRRV